MSSSILMLCATFLLALGLSSTIIFLYERTLDIKLKRNKKTHVFGWLATFLFIVTSTLVAKKFIEHKKVEESLRNGNAIEINYALISSDNDVCSYLQTKVELYQELIKLSPQYVLRFEEHKKWSSILPIDAIIFNPAFPYSINTAEQMKISSLLMKLAKKERFLASEYDLYPEVKIDKAAAGKTLLRIEDKLRKTHNALSMNAVISIMNTGCYSHNQSMSTAREDAKIIVDFYLQISDLDIKEAANTMRYLSIISHFLTVDG